MNSCERRYLSLFFNNTIKEIEDGDVYLRFALPQEFCAANKSKRKIRIVNYQFWTINDKEGTTYVDYDATTGIRLCADFNQSDPSNDNFIMLSNNNGCYHETKEFEYVTNKTSITIKFQDLLANDLSFKYIDIDGNKYPNTIFAIELELLYNVSE